MTSTRAWSRDLVLGMRLAFRGARMRTGLTAVGIGLSVGVLLFAASLPNAIRDHQGRVDDRSIYNGQSIGAGPIDGGAPPDQPTASTALAANVTTVWKGDRVSGTLIEPDGLTPPLPPGVRRLPGARELVVSPELARMLRRPDSDLLRQRLGGKVVGTIAPSGLSGPAERFYYGGSATLGSSERPVGAIVRLARFGQPGPKPPLDPFTTLLVLVGSVVLLFPIVILVSTASRFGSARRDRRLAALRLVGASRQETSRIAAGESLAAALLGILFGVSLFVGARAIVEGVEAFGFSLYAADVRPRPVLAAGVIGAVVLVTIGSTLLSMRRVSVEPLSVVRRGRGLRRRVWWRPLPTLAGFAILAPLIGKTADDLGDAQIQIGVGAVLVLAGIVVLLPWVVAATVRRLHGWSAASQLAVRNLQTEAAVAARIVSGIAVAIAGAIALQMLLTVPERDVKLPQQPGVVASNAAAGAYSTGTPADALRFQRVLQGTAGVTRVHVTTRQELRGHGQGDGMLPSLIVGDCAALRELASLQACDDTSGTMVRAVDPTEGALTTTQRARGGSGERTVVPAAGERVKAHPWWQEEWAKFTLPAELATVDARSDVNGRLSVGILATPGSVPPPAGDRTEIEAAVWLDPDEPLALEHLRTAVSGLDPLGNVYEPSTSSDAAAITTARRLLLAGATLLLMLIAASLVVTTLEQLAERRRSLATLAAFGTPRSVLRRALWWQTAIPVAIGIVLAVGIGTGLGAILLALQSEPINLDLAGTAGLIGVGVGMVVIVTAAGLPLLRRVAAPAAMRTE